MNASLRPATVEDRPSLEIVRRQALEAAFTEHYDRARYADLVATPDPELAPWLADDRYLSLLVETPATPVAYLVCDRRRAELLALYTSPDYEGRGYATRLLRSASDDIAESGAETLTIWAPEPSLGFFRTRGFTATDERTSEDIPRQRMAKSLERRR